MGRIHGDFHTSRVFAEKGPQRSRRKVAVARQKTRWLRRAIRNKMTVVKIQLGVVRYTDTVNVLEGSSPFLKMAKKSLKALKNARMGGRLILQLPSNKTAGKIPYNAWLDMLDELRAWFPTLTLPKLTSSALSELPLYIRYRDVVKEGPGGEKLDFLSLVWHLRKFPTISGFKCTVIV